MSKLSEYRRANYQQVLTDLKEENDRKPQRQPHCKPVKVISGKYQECISRPGVSFALPESAPFLRSTNDNDKRY